MSCHVVLLLMTVVVALAQPDCTQTNTCARGTCCDSMSKACVSVDANCAMGSTCSGTGAGATCSTCGGAAPCMGATAGKCVATSPIPDCLTCSATSAAECEVYEGGLFDDEDDEAEEAVPAAEIAAAGIVKNDLSRLLLNPRKSAGTQNCPAFEGSKCPAPPPQDNGSLAKVLKVCGGLVFLQPVLVVLHFACVFLHVRGVETN